MKKNKKNLLLIGSALLFLTQTTIIAQANDLPNNNNELITSEKIVAVNQLLNEDLESTKVDNERLNKVKIELSLLPNQKKVTDVESAKPIVVEKKIETKVHVQEKTTAKEVAKKVETKKVETTKKEVEKNYYEITVEASAYTANCKGCSGITATGINLKANPNQKVIAVDPSVIPLGTKVEVPGYGLAVAGDTGGAIKGNKIDIFVKTTDEAYAWGRKSVKIKVYK